MRNVSDGNSDVYIDEPCVVSFFVGELGWFIQRWQGYLRWLKHEQYPDHKFIVMMNTQLHVLIDDFVNYTVDLPKEFYDLKLETDCYESPLPDSQPGSLTPPNVWADLIAYVRKFYNKDKAIEIWTPRGYNTWVDYKPQTFTKYEAPLMNLDRPMVTVFPRARGRAADRNVPEFVWRDVVNNLSRSCTVVLGGTLSGACLVDMEGDNIINLITYRSVDKLDKTMYYICNSVCTLSSQSGPTHIALLCKTPSYIIGHEKERHTITDNRFGTPTSFRYVTDYRAIDAKTILTDLQGFFNALVEADQFGSPSSKENDAPQTNINRASLRTLVGKEGLVGVEIGTDRGDNALNILENLDIEKLYLVDPYSLDSTTGGLGVQVNNKECEQIEAEARQKLQGYEDKIVWVRKGSTEAAEDIPNDLDFVYVDGNHRYEYVKKDLETYYDKLKDDGLMSGHDLDYKEVQRAVEEFFEIKNMNVMIHGNSDGAPLDWWVVKPGQFDDILNEDTKTLLALIKEKNNG